MTRAGRYIVCESHRCNIFLADQTDNPRDQRTDGSQTVQPLVDLDIRFRDLPSIYIHCCGVAHYIPQNYPQLKQSRVCLA